VAGVRGHLHLISSDGPIELSARVVQYATGDGARYSWHGDLHAHLHERGRLTLDDGTEVEVAVGRVVLRGVEPIGSGEAR
jgi:hypothetical protein